jgi:hypothetical protein
MFWTSLLGKSFHKLSTMAFALARHAALRPSNKFTKVSSSGLRYFAGPLVDYDHYISGWNVEDISDFTQPGKYSVQTFNKISPQAS